MTERAREFVSEEWWLFVLLAVGVVLALVGMLGLGVYSGAVAIVVFVALMFVFLFWNDRIDQLFFGSRREESTDSGVENDGTGSDEQESEELVELKRRYAEGELSESEFERELDELLESEDLGVDDGIPEDDSDRTASGDVEAELRDLKRDRK